jgi:hypothetical protein
MVAIQHDARTHEVESRLGKENESGAICRVPDRDANAGRGEAPLGLREASELLAGKRGVLRFGGGEMRHKADQSHGSKGGDSFRDGLHLLWSNADAAHPRIDLQVQRDYPAASPGHTVHRLGKGWIGDGLIQIEGHHEICLVWGDGTEHEYPRGNPRCAQWRCLFRNGHPEPCGASL